MPTKPLKRPKGAPILGKPGQQIQLQSPQNNNYGAFIIGNAQFCDHVVEENSATGQHLVLCGAGPSLAEHAAEWCPQGDQVWGCNSALTYLYDRGHKVTHGFAIDQNPEMCREWVTAPPVDYLVASTVHPHLTEYLLSKQRKLIWFHNFVGIKEPPVAYALCHDCGASTDYEGTICPGCASENMERQMMSSEDYKYCALYPGTVRAGSGLNAVTRAIDVARFMGFDKITILGADCALRLKSKPPTGSYGTPAHLDWLKNETVMHADGGSALASNATPVTLGGEIDSGTPDERIRPGHGRWWETKPDLMISAVWLVQMVRKIPNVQLIGDTLPVALLGKTNAYLSMLPKMVDGSGKDIEFSLEDEG